MIRSLIHATLAAALFVGPLAAEAQQYDRQRQNDQAAQILTGLAVLGLLGLTIHELRDDDDDDDDDDGKRRGAVKPRHEVRHAALPRACLHRIETRQGIWPVYGARCLQRRYHAAHRLPRQCLRHVHAYGRERPVYPARCLRRQGWAVARHH